MAQFMAERSVDTQTARRRLEAAGWDFRRAKRTHEDDEQRRVQEEARRTELVAQFMAGRSVDERVAQRHIVFCKRCNGTISYPGLVSA